MGTRSILMKLMSKIQGTAPTSQHADVTRPWERILCSHLDYLHCKFAHVLDVIDYRPNANYNMRNKRCFSVWTIFYARVHFSPRVECQNGRKEASLIALDGWTYRPIPFYTACTVRTQPSYNIDLHFGSPPLIKIEYWSGTVFFLNVRIGLSLCCSRVTWQEDDDVIRDTLARPVGLTA